MKKYNSKKEISSTKYSNEFLINGYTINGISIPLSSLEDWYVIYQLLPNREYKVNLLEKYLLENGIEKPNLLEKSLRGNLSLNIRYKIERILI